MQDDDNRNNFKYFIVDFDDCSLMINDFIDLQRKDCFNNKVIK